MIKKMVYGFLIVFAGLVSCKSESKKTTSTDGEEEINCEGRYVTVNNETMDIGNVDVIYIFYNYWFGMGNYTFGVDDKTIDKKVMEIFPDTVTNLNNLHFGYIPTKIFLKQQALNYIAEYVINNCDTVVSECDYLDMHTIYRIFLVGEDGIVTCTYGDPVRKSDFFAGMIDWVDNYPGGRDIDTVIRYIRPMIYYPEENAE